LNKSEICLNLNLNKPEICLNINPA
jgi:hypothetical protein